MQQDHVKRVKYNQIKRKKKESLLLTQTNLDSSNREPARALSYTKKVNSTLNKYLLSCENLYLYCNVKQSLSYKKLVATSI